jgi:hypothetical protein
MYKYSKSRQKTLYPIAQLEEKYVRLSYSRINSYLKEQMQEQQKLDFEEKEVGGAFQNVPEMT